MQKPTSKLMEVLDTYALLSDRELDVCTFWPQTGTWTVYHFEKDDNNHPRFLGETRIK